jgi:hypothetical protein
MDITQSRVAVQAKDRESRGIGENSGRAYKTLTIISSAPDDQS